MFKTRLAIALAALLAFGVAAMAGNTVLFSSKQGDLTFPISPPSKDGNTPGQLDNTTIGATTKRAGTFTTLAADSATIGGGALPANVVSGVASGYKIARGETALDGANPTPAATGLTSIVACTATIKLATAPGVGTSVVTYGSSTGTLNLYGWKVTSSSDTTLIASDGTETVGWVCVGT